jgi:hypothetical protein
MVDEPGDLSAERPDRPAQQEQRTQHRRELEFGSRQEWDDPSLEWRRLFAELFGTFLLVMVAGGRRSPPINGPDQSRVRAGRPRAHGDGDHPVHGRGFWGAPQPRRNASRLPAVAFHLAGVEIARVATRAIEPVSDARFCREISQGG